MKNLIVVTALLLGNYALAQGETAKPADCSKMMGEEKTKCEAAAAATAKPAAKPGHKKGHK